MKYSAAMQRLLVVASVWLACACGGGKKDAASPAPQPIENKAPAEAPAQPAATSPAAATAMQKLREYTEQMCACSDQTCMQRVADDMTKWSQEMAKQQTEPVKMSDEEVKVATDLGTRMGECMNRLMANGQPTQSQPAQP
jgi:hypothetical protein